MVLRRPRRMATARLPPRRLIRHDGSKVVHAEMFARKTGCPRGRAIGCGRAAGAGAAVSASPTDSPDGARTDSCECLFGQ